jgi:hypothetical protein
MASQYASDPNFGMILAGLGASGLGAGLTATAGGGKPSVSWLQMPAPSPLYPGANEWLQYWTAQGGGQAFQSLINTATGTPSGVGGATLTSMATTGEPTNVGPAWQALVNAGAQTRQQGRENILEQFGAQGLNAASGPTGQALSNYESQSNTSLLNILADYTMKASEAAAGRKLTAATTLTSEQESASNTLAQIFQALGSTTYQQWQPILYGGTNKAQAGAGAASSSIGAILSLIGLLGGFGSAGEDDPSGD